MSAFGYQHSVMAELEIGAARDLVPVAGDLRAHPGVAHAAAWVHARAERLDRHVSPVVADVARRCGGVLVGTDYRIKSVASLQRKVAAIVGAMHCSPGEAGRMILDSLRYAMTFNEMDFSSGVRGVLDELNWRGYRLLEGGLRRYWRDGDRYKAVHAKVLTPHGLVIEIQFHTPSSYRVKVTTDAMWHQYLDPRTSPQTRALIIGAMESLSASIPTPPDIADLGVGESPRLAPVHLHVVDARLCPVRGVPLKPER